jgi:hypothetical protein
MLFNKKNLLRFSYDIVNIKNRYLILISSKKIK